jgi:alkylation response protein AidB-like acyl-CoA dehydrogenase
VPNDIATNIQGEILDFGAVGGPIGLGLMSAAPTITKHGSAEQIERYVRDIVTGQRAWCQLFSEPGAGSDLAGLTTRATRDGDVWRVNGQKVWTSMAQFADYGMLLARTDFDVPKHQGITWFALDMHQPGIEVRPLVEMTGVAAFNEVFLTDVVVRDEDIIGGLNQGWTVANSTLFHERSTIGARGARSARPMSTARPGTVAGDLERRAGDFVVDVDEAATVADGPAPSVAQPYIDLAREFDRIDDPVVRQGLAQLHILGELGRLNQERARGVSAAGGEIPGLGNMSKLARADVVRLGRDLGLGIMGPRATLHAYTDDGLDALVADVQGGTNAATLVKDALHAQGLPIYGGTDQIQRNIIAERVLGLPKERDDVNRRPFSELPRNA